MTILYDVKISNCTDREERLIYMFTANSSIGMKNEAGLYDKLTTTEYRALKHFVELLNPTIKIESTKYRAEKTW